MALPEEVIRLLNHWQEWETEDFPIRDVDRD